MRGDLFSPAAVRKMCADVAPTEGQRAAAKKWLELLGAGKLAEGRTNHPRFMEIVLEGMLGYGSDDIEYERGNVDFQYAPGGNPVACFEVRGTSTGDLFAPQRRSKKDHYAPIRQTWDYMGSSGAAYGICSNCRHFVLLTRQFGYARYYLFDFEGIRGDPDRLGEFIGVFSKDRMSGGFVERARAESDNEERELTEEFYDLYGRTRLMLAREFESSGGGGGGGGRDAADASAQEFLNRLVFIFFAEDSGLSGRKGLFIDNVVDALGGTITANTRRVSTYVTDELFVFCRDGCDDPYVLAIPGSLFGGRAACTASFPDKRNGGFFGGLERGAAPPGRRPWGSREKVRRAVESREGINPVIKNLLALASYGLCSRIRVDMLGRIFEESLSDSGEWMPGGAESTRMRKAVHYTPEYMTRYVCHRTIIPHLSRSGTASDPAGLVDEYAEDLDELDRRIDAIRILDPACGSGAFLIEAARTLSEIHGEAKRRREADGGADHGTLNPSIYDARIRRIAAENLYGMDANPQSAEIARLSLLLLTASAGEAPPDMSGRIVAGDGVSSGGGGRQDWGRLFADVFSGGDPGFSVVVGRPPYAGRGAIGPAGGGMPPPRPPEGMPPLDLPGGFRMPGGGDPGAHFCARSLGLLRNGGRLGLISGGGWMRTECGAALQRVMLDNAAVDVVAAAGFRVFRGADASTAVVIARRGRPGRDHVVTLATAGASSDFAGPSLRTAATVRQSDLEPGDWGALFDGATAEAEAGRGPGARRPS